MYKKHNMKLFPHYTQPDAMDCGPRMITKFYGRNYALQTLREKALLPMKAYLCWVLVMQTKV